MANIGVPTAAILLTPAVALMSSSWPLASVIVLSATTVLILRALWRLQTGLLAAEAEPTKGAATPEPR